MAFLRWALVMVPLVLLLGLASAMLGQAGPGNRWFASLARPPAMPPDWLFPLAWTLLYILMGIALALVLSARGARGRRIAVALFVIQLALNLGWSPLFFGAHRIDAALILIALLFVVAVLAAWRFAAIRPLAGALMLPYLAWLLFAGYLNYEIARLNPDAGALAPGGANTQIRL